MLCQRVNRYQKLNGLQHHLNTTAQCRYQFEKGFRFDTPLTAPPPSPFWLFLYLILKCYYNIAKLFAPKLKCLWIQVGTIRTLGFKRRIQRGFKIILIPHPFQGYSKMWHLGLKPSFRELNGENRVESGQPAPANGYKINAVNTSHQNSQNNLVVFFHWTPATLKKKTSLSIKKLRLKKNFSLFLKAE